jgi:hypothetical protein
MQTQDSFAEHPFGFAQNGKVYLKAQLGNPEREIGIVVKTPEEAIQYFVNRFQLIEGKVDTLIQQIEQETTNKGSFLMRLQHLKEQLYTYNAIGDFSQLLEKLNQVEDTLKGNVQQNRIRNLQIKQQLLEQLEQLKDSNEWREATEEVAKIKERWIKIGAVVEELQESIEKDFTEKLDYFYGRRKQFLDERHALIESRLHNYKNLLRRMESLLQSDEKYNPNTVINKFMEEWKSLGKIPRERMDEFWKMFKRKRNALRKKVAHKKTPADLTLEKNYKTRLSIIAEVESLLPLDPQADETLEKLKLLQEKWKNAGQVDKKLVNDINNKFRNACDRVQEKEFLYRVARYRNKSFDEKPETEKTKIKIEILEEFIRKGELDLQSQEYKYSILTEEEKQSKEGKSAFFKLETQKRKLGVKKVMLAALKP